MKKLLNSMAGRYTKQGLWSLFLICAFPLHIWTLILVFRDMSWLIERTNFWDALGVASYGLIYTFLESVLIFIIVALLGLVTPKDWSVDRRVAFLGLLILLTSIWGMISQLLFIWNTSLPEPVFQFLVQSGHPLRYLYGGVLSIVLVTILPPVYLFLRSDKFFRFLQEVNERLSLLTTLYLFFDLAGLVIVVIRNV